MHKNGNARLLRLFVALFVSLFTLFAVNGLQLRVKGEKH